MNDLRGILSHRSSDSALNVSMQMDIDISLSPSPRKMKEEAVQEGCKTDETPSTLRCNSSALLTSISAVCGVISI